ncbi:MAG: TonB-dependent receptor [Bacteroidetes bacterium]|nr:MAG: TonB-dependent receptor [Bacteroidota bacterium]
MKLFQILFFILSLTFSASAQDLTQTIRGSILDQNTKEPLVGALIEAYLGETKKGAITDVNGNFRFENMKVGRYTLQFSFLGYENAGMSQLEVISSKETVLNIEMIEKITTTGTIIVRARKDKAKTINQMVSVSGRTFSIEESQRYAGSRGDVARMAQNFAGVQGADDSRNDIVVRGNSPMGVLYRLEGVDIPNPNHFSTAGTTGGPVSMLNNNVLENSDFLSGAFPAEYGNATAAVFDLGMRKGNDEQYEFLGQIGFAGLEFMAEGPLSKKSKASFLVNYRYSALGFFSLLGLQFGTGTAVPKYQDLSFHLHFPDKTGSFKIFGVAGLSSIELFQSEDTGDNLFGDDLEDLSYTTNTGMVGISRFQKLGTNTFAKITLAADASQTKTQLDTFALTPNNEIISNGGLYRDNSYQGKYSINAFVQHKFNSRNTIKGGIRVYNYFFSLRDSFYRTDRNVLTNQPLGWVEPTNFDGSTSLIQTFVSQAYRVNSKLNLNVGLNNSFFTYNNSNSIEPRAGISYKLSKKYKISAGYGLHSQLAPFRVYFEERTDTFGIKRKLNQDLGFTKSHHFIIGNDIRLGKNTRLKIEGYVQYLFDVPIDGKNDTFYSLLNQGADFGVVFTDSMVNTGKGRNLGVEITFERFLTKGFYFLNTLSLYRSFYTDQLGNEHPTVFDSRYAINLLGGKEFYFAQKTNKKGKIKKSSLTTDVKFIVNGGRRYTPANEFESRRQGELVLDNSRIFSNQYDDYIRFDLRIAYKVQTKKITQEWGIDIQNLTNKQNIFNRTYNPNTNEYKTTYQTGLLPIGIYRVTF